MEIDFNLATSKSSTFVLKLFRLVGTLTNLLISSWSTSAFKAEVELDAELDASTPLVCFSFFKYNNLISLIVL